MASLTPLLSLPLITKEDVRSTQFPLITPDDVLQLQADVINVINGHVDINSFSVEYQKKIRDYYRFDATRQNSKSHNIAFRTNDTLDIT